MQLFSIADFRRLWLIGFAFSVVRWLETLALALYAYQLTSSAFIVAMLTMLRLLPMGLFGAFFGAASERFDRRRVLILVVSVQTTVSLTLGVLAWLDAIAIWHLAAASFINGAGWATDHPVRRMMIGDSVGAERVGAALSLDTASTNGKRVLGPVLSGVLLAHFGILSVFCVSIALYLPSLVAAIRIGMRREAHAFSPASFFTSIREGFAWARRDPGLMGVFLITIIYNIFGWPATSMVPVIGTDVLRLGPEGVGLLAACDGVGGLVGALLVAGRARPAWYGRLYVSAVAMYLVMVVLFAASPIPGAAGIALLLGGTSGAAFAVMQATLVYRAAPVAMRARLLGVISVCIGTGPIGFLYLGWLAEAFTPRIATMALAAQGLLVMLATRRYWLATLRL